MGIYLKFEDQTLSKELKKVRVAAFILGGNEDDEPSYIYKTVCELGYEWHWQGDYNPSGSGWYREVTFKEYEKITNKL